MADVSVLVATQNPGSALPGLVRALDAQSLAAAAFEVVFVDASDDGSTARLEQLAGRRPNVTVLTADAGTPTGERLRLALEAATGAYVLAVGQRQRLAPRALELLLDTARRTGADLVLGRAATADGSGSAALPDDADRLDLPGVRLTGCCVMVRRSLVAGLPDPGAALLDVPALVDAVGTASAVGRYACLLEDEAPIRTDAGVSLEPSTYAWGDGTLRLTVGVRMPEPAPTAPAAWLVVTRGLAEIALPATIVGDGGKHTVSSVLDPRTADGGDPLEDGAWDLLLRLAWPGTEVTLPLVPEQARSAVLAGRPYVARRAGQGLQLDAGATRSSVIGPVPKSRTSLAESVHGTLVTFEYPTLHVPDDAVLDARLVLDGFALPGHLVCENGRARLEVYASALAGSSAVAVIAGGGKPVPTRLRLRVDGTGGMSFEDAPAPAPAPAPGGVPLVQRLRRRLPGALEPVANRLVQVRALRRAYRRLIRR